MNEKYIVMRSPSWSDSRAERFIKVADYLGVRHKDDGSMSDIDVIEAICNKLKALEASCRKSE